MVTMNNWLVMMKSGTIALAITLAMTGTIAAAPVYAQAPIRIKQNSAWGSYSHQGESGKTCYILSMPTEKLPADRDHGEVFFMLAQHPGQSATLEPQFTVGYAFKDDSRVTLEIDGKQFNMFTQGQNAWMENPAEESIVVEAMRAGTSMSLSGESRRGTQTRYTYSLSGVTASLSDIQECR
jgi:hypothetical protein